MMFVCAGFVVVPEHTFTQHSILPYPLWISLNKIDMMAMASCSLHLSLLNSDEIILTFSLNHEGSSRAFHPAAAFSITIYVKSENVYFGA